MDDNMAAESLAGPIVAAPMKNRPRRNVADELARLEREKADREAQLSELRAQLIEARGGETRRSSALRGLGDQWQEMLARTDHLDRLLWNGGSPERFDPGEVRVRVLQHLEGFSHERRLEWLEYLTFLPTPQVERLWRRLDGLMRTGRGEMANLRVVGMQGSGKTWAVTLFALRANRALRVHSTDIPVVLLEAPADGTSLAPMFREGLARMGEPTGGRDDVVVARFYHKMAERNVRLIVIDEAGNLDTERRRRGLRRLTNVLKLPIVAVSAEAEWAGDDEHLARRFYPLHRFGPHKGADLIELFATLEAYLPFRGGSNLFTTDQVVDGKRVEGAGTYIEQCTKGLIDRVVALVYRAARIAIANDHDAITLDDLKAGWREYLVVGGADGVDDMS